MQQLALLAARYRWPTTVTSAVVPGYSSDYNGCDLYAFFDGGDYMPGLGAGLAKNPAAAYVLVREEMRGAVVFAAKIRTRDDLLVSSSYGISSCSNSVGLSRRDVLVLAEYNHLCGSRNVVSRRIHFENIRRAESLLYLKSQSYTIIE